MAREATGRTLYVRRADGTADLVTPLGETKVREVEWAGDDHIVIITSAPVALEGVAMQEMAGAVDIDLNTRKSFTLLGGSKSYLDAIFGWYGAANIDGVWHPFVGGVSTDRMGNPRADGIVLPSLYRINLVTGEPKLIGTPGPGSTRWVIGPDGSVVGRSSNGATGRETSLYAGAGQDAVTGFWQVLEGLVPVASRIRMAEWERSR